MSILVPGAAGHPGSPTADPIAGATVDTGCNVATAGGPSPWHRRLGWFGRRWQIAVLAALAGYFMVWPLWRLGFPIQIDVNEGFNSYLADAAMGAAPLYPPPGTLTVNNYPPLSFYVTGGLAKLFGVDALYVGRVLSIVAVTGLGGLIAAIIRVLGGGPAGAAVGGLWFVAIMARSYSAYVGMDDPQLAAHAVMMAALVWFLVRERSGRSLLAPVLAMVVAGFYKHNVVAVPVTALTFVAIADWRRAVSPAVVGAAAAALGLAACAVIYGGDFAANLLTPRVYEAMRSVQALGRAQYLIPALVLWGVWIAVDRRGRAARFTMLFVAAGFAAFVMESCGDGVGDNAQFDLVIATATGLGMAFDRAGKTAFGRRHGETAAQAVVVAAVALRLLATLRVEPALVLLDTDYRGEYAANAALVRSEAARIAAMSDAVTCDAAVVCRFAGKPHTMDWFKVVTLVKMGRSGGLDPDDLIRSRGLTRILVDPRDTIEPLVRSVIPRP